MLELFSFTKEKGGLTLFNIRKKNLHKRWKVLSVSYVRFTSAGGYVGISKVFIVSKSFLPSSKLLVQAKKKKKKSANQWDPLPCQK